LPWAARPRRRCVRLLDLRQHRTVRSWAAANAAVAEPPHAGTSDRLLWWERVEHVRLQRDDWALEQRLLPSPTRPPRRCLRLLKLPRPNNVRSPGPDAASAAADVLRRSLSEHLQLRRRDRAREQRLLPGAARPRRRCVRLLDLR
jgi:hypothetical protein